jgi:hypothetical protein
MSSRSVQFDAIDTRINARGEIDCSLPVHLDQFQKLACHLLGRRPPGGSTEVLG